MATSYRLRESHFLIMCRESLAVKKSLKFQFTELRVLRFKRSTDAHKVSISRPIQLNGRQADVLQI